MKKKINKPKPSETLKGRQDIARHTKIYFSNYLNFIHKDDGFPFVGLINTPNEWKSQKYRFNKEFTEVLNNYKQDGLDGFGEILNNEEDYHIIHDDMDAYFVPKKYEIKDILNITEIYISTKPRKKK